MEQYVYTPGLHGLEFAKALREGKLLGTKCGDTVYFPPTTLCPDFSESELVEVKGPWIVESFTIIYEDTEGRPLEKPLVVALITPLDAEGAIYHILEIEPERVVPGTEVEPVFVEKEKRTGKITDILFFKPTGEA